MKTIKVNASTEYDVLIGTDLLKKLGDLVGGVCKTQTVVIVSDSNVWPIYGQRVTQVLQEKDFACISFVIEAGEQSKSGQNFLALLEFLAENHITRTDCLLALGGGVVGDLTGFAAATFLRGIDFIQVPTSLLACVDSSVGGKTAIDLQAGKNLAGAFYQPKLVVCDIETLTTLPENIFLDGCAEVIKYGVLYDPELFAHLQEFGPEFDKEWVISRCVALKRDVVAEDEFDRGARQKLNLGHTIGHGIEADSNFTVSHGQAVAMGMAIISRWAAKAGICDRLCTESIVNILTKFRLPFSTEADVESIYHHSLSDKKRSGGTVNLIVPEVIGQCRIVPTAVSKLKSIIEAGL